MPSVNVSGLASFAYKYQKEIITQVYLKLEDQGLTVIEDVSVSMKFPKFIVGNTLQQYNSTFAGAGTIVFSDRELVVHDAKAEYSIDSYAFESTYLRLNRKDATLIDIPYENYFWQKIIEKLADEIVKSVIWYGDTADTSSNLALRITDGFAKMIAAAVTAGSLTPVVTGVPDATNAVSKFEGLYSAAMAQYPALESADDLTLYASKSQVRNYLINYRSNFPFDPNIYSDGNKNLDLKISNGKCKIMGVDWLAGSNKLILTPQMNLKFGTNKMSDMNAIRMVEKEWTQNIGIRFVMGLQIADTEVLFVNDAT